MSLFSFLKRNKESYSLVFDIGSGRIAGGLIKFTAEEGVNVAYYAQEAIPFQQEVSPQKHLELMKSALAALAQKVQAEGLKKLNRPQAENILVDRAFYIFSSPWSVSQTKTIRVKEPKAFKVTESHLNQVIDEQEKHWQTDISLAGKIIERKIIQVKLNGYVVGGIYNQTAPDLEVSVLFTAVPTEILQTVNDAVAKTFRIKNIWCHSQTLAIFSVVRNLFPQKDDYIHIDVSEEITDITVVKDGIITTTATIPFGRHHFIRALSAGLKVTEEIADSMINIHNRKDNNELAGLKLAVAMDGAAKDWLVKIFEVLDSLKEKIYVPEAVFVIAQSDLILFLKEKLQKHDFKVSLIDNKKIKPTAAVGDDIMYKLALMFLDKLYKI